MFYSCMNVSCMLGELKGAVPIPSFSVFIDFQWKLFFIFIFIPFALIFNGNWVLLFLFLRKKTFVRKINANRKCFQKINQFENQCKAKMFFEHEVTLSCRKNFRTVCRIIDNSLEKCFEFALGFLTNLFFVKHFRFALTFRTNDFFTRKKTFPL